MLYAKFLCVVAAFGASARVVERQDQGRNHILNYLCTGDESKGDMPGTCHKIPNLQRCIFGDTDHSYRNLQEHVLRYVQSEYADKICRMY